MDEKHSKGLLRVAPAIGAVLLLFQASAFAVLNTSYGTGVCKSFGPPEQKDVWIDTQIFIPVEGKITNLDLALDLIHTSFCDLFIVIDSPQGT